MNKRVAALFFAGALAAAPGLAVGQENLKGDHTMQGEITSINKETGEVEVNTQPVPIKVHFPADAVADLNEGDTITVHLAFETQQ